MATANEQAALCTEILAQAHREAEQILQHAQQAAAALHARAAAEAEQLRQQRLEQARKEAARRKELILATIPLETARLRAARVEALLRSLYEEAHRRLLAREGFDYRETLIRLAVEAIKQMANNRLVIKLSRADHQAMGEAFVQEITRRVASASSLSITLTEDPGLTGGGLIVQDAEGHLEWDNRLTARLNRLWPQLRQHLALDMGLAVQEMRERPLPTRPSARGGDTFHGIPPSTGPVITRISGPIVTASGMAQAQMYEVVHVGPLGLVGEVVRLVGDRATIQVYEDTTMLQPGAPVQLTGAPLSVWLGPGLVGQIYDGIQRPLPGIQARSGAWIRRGEKVEPLDTARRWTFEPLAHPGQAVSGGQVIGEVPETPLVRHRVMLPPEMSGVLRSIAGKGDYTLRETVAVVETPAGTRDITLLQRWPVRVPRPIRERLRIEQPLITGQRVIDTFFPLGKGGAAAIPGGFGTGKTITQHQLAKWSDAHLILFIGCGERGNEMTEVLREFPQLQDPRSGRPLMERTILIANTSNMPVAAREVSIYTGISLAEYYRDMGLNVAVFADSTSRWAEALRELAARLEEMPAEEGFPASLPTRLAQFYERGGAVATLGGERGSISIVGAVSPPGGDFSEPVTQHTRRFIRCFWALDTELANARHYPSIHWLHSYSEYVEEVCTWWEQHAPGWSELRTEALTLLQREERLQQIVKLVGPDVLPPAQRLILFVAELLKDGFLAQSAFDENDMYCTPERQILLLRILLSFHRLGRELLQAGVPLEHVRALPCVPEVLRAKSTFANTQLAALTELEQRVKDQLGALAKASTQPPR